MVSLLKLDETKEAGGSLIMAGKALLILARTSFLENDYYRSVALKSLASLTLGCFFTLRAGLFLSKSVSFLMN
jgi:hypothetical protein